MIACLNVGPGDSCLIVWFRFGGFDPCVPAGIDDFGDYLIDHEGETITLFVYNADADAVREVSILLTTHSWGENNDTGLGTVVLLLQV
jgi:GRASP55/65 PDZ-like domain